MKTNGIMHRSLWIAFPSLLVVLLFVVWKEQGRAATDGKSVSKRRLRSSPTKGASVIDELLSVSSRYYIYEDATISQARRIEKFRREGGDLEVQFDHVAIDIEGELNILQALQWNPLRTLNPDEAQVFIVPTPVTELLAYGCHWEECKWFDDAFDALSKHPIFVENQGRNHVLISQSWPLFNKRYAAYMPAISRNYKLLENVTVANHFDPFGCMDLLDELSKDSVTPL